MLTHRSNHLTLTINAFRCIGEKLHITCRLHDAINTNGKLGKEAVGQIIDHKPDNLRFRLPEIGGRAIIDIAEFLDRFLNLSPGLGMNQRTIA